ncbi:MAG: HAMP domain-containing protein [Treponema sp.]|nr:HAMP domain-containing protein [Treponema sp.]
MPKVIKLKSFPLSIKLAVIIGLIIISSLTTVTFLNSYFISADIKTTAQSNNMTINARSALSVKNELSSIRANILQLLDLINSSGYNTGIAKQAEVFFFERNQDIAEISLITINEKTMGTTLDVHLKNSRFFSSNEIDPDLSSVFIEQIKNSLLASINGETIVLNASPYFNRELLSLIIPYKESGLNQCCLILFSMEKISGILTTTGSNETFIINVYDDLLVHPDSEKIICGMNMKNHPFVKKIRDTNQNNEEPLQFTYEEHDEKGKKHKYFGAYQKINIADIWILTSIPVNLVIEGVIKTRNNNFYLMGVVLFISFILIITFTRFAISKPLRHLTSAAEEIQKGNFNTEIISTLNTKRLDEIGILNKSTQDEQEFLNIFAKFTNRGVAKAIARKEIDFEPHLKDVTIFFSDIRGFTAISDGFKNRFGEESPKQIISFLNDYMSRMVNCITISGGTIDKFEGDAIMAVWGILRDDDLSFEQLPDSNPSKKQKEASHNLHVKQDAVNAIKGTIAMRYALMQYNKDARKFTEAHKNELKAEYKPHIRIGCGLNTGRATCGIMGSEDKMEYTAIGDSVNFASRTESSNKPCGTDILITQDTYNLLKNDYIRCPENNFTIPDNCKENEIIVEQIPVEFEVKGKGSQHFYGVVNMPQFNIREFFRKADKNFKLDCDCAKCAGPGGPETLNDVRNLLGIQVPDFKTVNLNEEENKIQVKQ